MLVKTKVSVLNSISDNGHTFLGHSSDLLTINHNKTLALHSLQYSFGP